MVAQTSVDDRSAGPAGRRWLGLLGQVGLALLLTLVAISPPRVCARTDVDSSWSVVLDYARQHHLQFGSDLVFTYGPLGYLVSPFYSPQADALRLVVNGLLCFFVAFGVCLVAWRLSFLWASLLVGAFAFVVANIHSGADVLINLGLVCWGLLCLLEDNPRRLAAFGCSFVGLAVFGLMVKLTYLAMAGLSVGVVAFDLSLRGKPISSVVLVGALFAGLTLAWLAAGQNLLYAGPYILNGLALCAGFDKAMFWDCPQSVLWGGVLISLLALVSVGLRAVSACDSLARLGRARAALLFGWLCALLFVTWKHGFVRADRSHVEFYLFFVPLVLLLLEVLPAGSSRARELARALAACCCVAAALILEPMFFKGYLNYCLNRPLRLVPENLKCLVEPGKYLREMRHKFDSQQQRAQLPLLSSITAQSRVDVFGWAQSYAVFNGLNFAPRPVFQSYAAYTPKLAQMNEDYYLGNGAPQFVLFKLSALDDRFPALDDAPLLRDLLLNYQLVEGEDGLLLLKSARSVRPRLTLLREGSIRASEPIPLPEGETNLWMEIALEPSLLGRARQFLYRPGRVHLRVLGGPAVARDAEFEAPAAMLAGGFLASPLLLGNGDVVDLYAGGGASYPKAYSIELGHGEEGLWQESIRFRLYRIDNSIANCGSQGLQRLKFPGFQFAPVELTCPSNSLAIYKGKPLLGADGGAKVFPLDILSTSNAVLTMEGKPALLLSPGGSMRFHVPEGAQSVRGTYGLADGGRSSGATHNAEFRVEEQWADGTLHPLHSQPVQDCFGTNGSWSKRFSIPLTGTRERSLILKTVAGPETTTGTILSCWAGIEFN